MSRVYESELGSPGIWRNYRFWLAADHVVHPDAAPTPTMRDLIARAEKAKPDFKMTEYQGLNYTIMHTEFVRERAEPGTGFADRVDRFELISVLVPLEDLV
ncbi:hypothetical protein BDV09DRAFT_201522 [Aspergillus tetrazonus]